jgi:hypothetical protein
MIYLFSSNARGLYVRDVLDACCYPEGHVMRLRYSEAYFSEAVKHSPATAVGKKGLVVFADIESPNIIGSEQVVAPKTVSNTSATDFRFYPIREIEIVGACLIADVLLVDVRLGSFVNYGTETDFSRESEWNNEIKALPQRPHPPESKIAGYFFYLHDGPGIQYSTTESREQLAWRSVIERINRSSLRDAITFRVIGFYRVGRFLASFGRTTELKISPTVTGRDCVYSFRMGELILLRLLFYRTRSAPEVRGSLIVRADKQAFTSTSKDQIDVQFRYNEERILLLCNRITDPVLSCLSILEKQDELHSPPASHPLFTIRVSPPTGFLFITAVLFAFGLLFLNLTAQDTATLRTTLASFFAAYHVFGWAGDAAVKLLTQTRWVGTLLVMLASWRYIRKFPLK